MNSAAKLIYITMAITWWQFSLVRAGDTSDELTDKKDTAYQALELNANSELILFLPHSRDDQDQESKLSDQSLKFLYFCPSQEDWHTEFNVKMERSCLFVVEISNERKTVVCKNPVVPSHSLNKEKKCGINSRGVEHSLRHQLFYPTNFLKITRLLSLNMEQYKNLAQNALEDPQLYLTDITIYQFCFYHDTHETAFASYTINSSSSKESQIPQSFDTRLTENDDQLFGLDDAPLCYKKENQSFFGTNVGDDYLVEQMLVPWNAIAENIERDTTKNYVNVSPQWKSLRNDWNNLNEYFKLISTQLVICGTFETYNNVRIGKTQVDEEQQQEMSPDQLHDSNTLKKPNLTLTVPVYWWKLVVFSQNTGIMLIMPNYPKGFDLSSDIIKPLCEDVCNEYGWTEIKLINPTITCCEPEAELIAKLLSSNRADIKKNIPSLTLPRYKSPQLEYLV